MFLLANVVSLPESSSFMGAAANRPASSITYIILPTNRFLSALQGIMFRNLISLKNIGDL